MQNPSDATIRELLQSARVVACVGFSDNPSRPSHGVAAFLVSKGVRVIPVNPKIAGQTFLGTRAVASLGEIEAPVDMIDVFRRPEHVPGIVEDVLTDLTGKRAIWLQLGVVHEAAAARARAAGLTVVQDRCPRIEWPRLIG